MPAVAGHASLPLFRLALDEPPVAAINLAGEVGLLVGGGEFGSNGLTGQRGNLEAIGLGTDLEAMHAV